MRIITFTAIAPNLTPPKTGSISGVGVGVTSRFESFFPDRLSARTFGVGLGVVSRFELINQFNTNAIAVSGVGMGTQSKIEGAAETVKIHRAIVGVGAGIRTNL